VTHAREFETNAAHLRAALEAANAGTFDIDVTGAEPPRVTDRLMRLFGFSPDNTPTLADYLNRVHPDDRADVEQHIQRSIGTGQGHYVEYRILSPADGGDTSADRIADVDAQTGEARQAPRETQRPLWVASRAEAILDDQGRTARLVGVVFDISPRRRTEDALRASESRFRALADAMPQLVWTAGSDGVPDYYNARVSEYAGIERTDAGTWVWRPVVHPDDLDRTLDAWRAAVEAGARYACEHRVRMANGTFRWHVSRAELVRDAAGERWFGTATDIHEQKLAEEGLRRAVLTRDQVVSVVAHDLRGPLSVVRMALHLLRDGLGAGARDGLLEAVSLPEAPLSLLARVDRQVTKMEKLLAELLDAAKLQAGQPLDLDRRPCDLITVVRESVEEHAAAAKWHPLRVHADVAQIVGDWDEARLERVVTNLLSNAIKYSPRGSTIDLHVGAHDGFAWLRVSDRGMGIAEHDRERIFEWFARGENAEQTARGTGIGLAGARRILEQHGGTLTVESTLREGSTFLARLPLRRNARLERQDGGGGPQ
jgi:PAS domain S-box-containing protein